jgi:hypothetical protein
MELERLKSVAYKVVYALQMAIEHDDQVFPIRTQALLSFGRIDGDILIAIYDLSALYHEIPICIDTTASGTIRHERGGRCGTGCGLELGV